MNLIELSQNQSVYLYTGIYCFMIFGVVWVLYKGNVKF